MAKDAPPTDIFRHTAVSDPTEATVDIDLETRLNSPVDPKLYARFSEHLERRVYHGMEAQILYNPVFGD